MFVDALHLMPHIISEGLLKPLRFFYDRHGSSLSSQIPGHIYDTNGVDYYSDLTIMLSRVEEHQFVNQGNHFLPDLPVQLDITGVEYHSPAPKFQDWRFERFLWSAMTGSQVYTLTVKLRNPGRPPTMDAVLDVSYLWGFKETLL